MLNSVTPHLLNFTFCSTEIERFTASRRTVWALNIPKFSAGAMEVLAELTKLP